MKYGKCKFATAVAKVEGGFGVRSDTATRAGCLDHIPQLPEMRVAGGKTAVPAKEHISTKPANPAGAANIQLKFDNWQI